MLERWITNSLIESIFNFFFFFLDHAAQMTEARYVHAKIINTTMPQRCPNMHAHILTLYLLDYFYHTIPCFPSAPLTLHFPCLPGVFSLAIPFKLPVLALELRLIGRRPFGVVGVGEGFLKLEMRELKNPPIPDPIPPNVARMFSTG